MRKKLMTLAAGLLTAQATIAAQETAAVTVATAAVHQPPVLSSLFDRDNKPPQELSSPVVEAAPRVTGAATAGKATPAAFPKAQSIALLLAGALALLFVNRRRLG